MDVMEPQWENVLNEHGWIPARRESRYALGCDLGQSIDPTAISVVERIREPIPPEQGGVGGDLIQKLGPARYECRHLERLPLQTPYPAVISHVGALLARAPLRGNCELVLDATGVGRAVCDMFAYAGLDFTAITITSGERERRDQTGAGWHVAKLQLVSRLQALFHSGELRVAKSLLEANTLARELQDFRATISESGFASFGARVGKHDDLVLALAVACWFLVGPRGLGIEQVQVLL